MAKSAAAPKPAVPPSRRLSNLKMVWRFTLRYPAHLAAAALSLLVAASATLFIPRTFQKVIDHGFGRMSDTGNIAPYFQGLLAVVLVLAVATAFRFYFVSWLGERTVADIRVAVQANLLRLAPRYFEENRPSEIASRLPHTAILAAGGVLLAILFGVTAGVAAAIAKRRWVDRIVTSAALVAVSTPSYWLALMGMLVFALHLALVPSIGVGTPLHYLMPIAVLGLQSGGQVARMTRAAMRETLAHAYVKAAEARGVGRSGVIIRHALANAALPVVTLIGLRVGGLLVGTVLVEAVFSAALVLTVLQTQVRAARSGHRAQSFSSLWGHHQKPYAPKGVAAQPSTDSPHECPTAHICMPCVGRSPPPQLPAQAHRRSWPWSAPPPLSVRPHGPPTWPH